MPGNPQATLYIGNLDERVDERVLYEIMVQAGPLIDVYIPRDRGAGRHKGYGFAEFTSAQSAQYALNLFAGIVFLHNKQLRLALSGQDKPTHFSSKGAYDSVISRPSETTTRFNRRTPPLSPPLNFLSPSANNNSPGLPFPNQDRYFSPIAYHA
eukprot:c18061_g1_i1 orf=138-599(+)